MLEVWSLLVHHLGQELVLQPISGHCEVNEGGLGLNLRFVVRIGQFGVKNQSEAWMEETLFVSDLYAAAAGWREDEGRVGWRDQNAFCARLFFSQLPALLDCVPPQKRVNNGVNCLLEVFDQHSVSRHHSLLNNVYVSGKSLVIILKE